MIEIKNKEKCCGCTACYNICPKNCITMEPDNEGFLYPIVDKTTCINCNLCEKVCPIKKCEEINTSKKPKACVVQNTSLEILKNSTSGGVIDALNKYVIDKNGFAVGVAYDDDFMPYHEITDKYDNTIKFRGSKYAQSRLNNIFKNILELLNKGELVLFTGTPCQVSGLKSYIQKDYKNLITVDLVCRSVPSPLLFKHYLNWQKKRYKSEIVSMNCRNKTYGYHNGSLVINFKNGKKYSGSNRVDLFMKSFHNDICSRPSCYDCQFKTVNRVSDFTVFDCWKPNIVTNNAINDNNKGYSNVFLHTSKAENIINQLQNIKIWPSNIDLVLEYTGNMESTSIKKNEKRDMFYNVLNKSDFETCIKQFIKISKKDYFIESLKPILLKNKK
ncbi:MAG: Coenzyme F420 hydrogenase/dehydrogenase, beta subunit C-terminal domain [Clostridia bacterium]